MATPALAGALPNGYWIDVDESGTTTLENLGLGYGSLQASGQANVNYGGDEECAPGEADGGPFSINFYPPLICNHDPRKELGRPFASPPNGFWFTGNELCVAAGKPYSGSIFSWHVGIPQSGYWSVEAYTPNWTQYGFGMTYTLTTADGGASNTFTQQEHPGQWVELAGPHLFDAGQEYTASLGLGNVIDGHCHYQTADQMRWVYHAPPSVASVRPIAGPTSGETSVMISGANFTGATAVSFGAQSATSFEVNSPNTITAKTPAEAPGTVDVTVTNAGGTSATGAADHFTFVPSGLPAPTIKKLAPQKGPAAGGTSVTITGANFYGVTAVKFGAANASYEVPSSTSIVAVAPPGIPGKVPVTVVTPNGENAASAKARFTYGPPTVMAVSPNTGSKAGGTTVSVSGSGFAVGVNTTAFTFGKGIATSVDCTTSTTCTMLASAAGKTGTVDVQAKVNGKKSKKSPPSDQFTYE